MFVSWRRPAILLSVILLLLNELIIWEAANSALKRRKQIKGKRSKRPKQKCRLCPSALQLQDCLPACGSSCVSNCTEVWQGELPFMFPLPASVSGEMPHVGAKVSFGHRWWFRCLSCITQIGWSKSGLGKTWFVITDLFKRVVEGD